MDGNLQMSARVRTIALFIFLFASSFAFGASDCERLLQSPPIPRTPQPKYVIELESAGQIIRLEDPIPYLGSAYYIFLVTADGEILLSKQYDAKSYMETGKGLATHKSLLNMYQETKLTSVQYRIVAAGEFQAAFGRIIYLTNRSGNFRNTMKRLALCRGCFEERGFLFDKEVLVTPTQDRGHTPKDRDFDEYKLEVLKAIEMEPNGPELIKLYERFHALILESFPKETARESIAEMLKARAAGAAVTNETRAYSAFYYPLLTAYNRDGLEYGLLAFFRSEMKQHPPRPEYDYREAIASQIENVIIGAGEKFNKDLKEKWKKLAEAFLALK